jgi:hypothetical protein
MRKLTLRKLTLIAVLFLGAATLSIAPVSLHWSAGTGVSVSQDKAQALVGHPATPGSVAGVERRTARRVGRRHW